MINPTKNAYNYYWTCLDVKTVKSEAAFKVVSAKGQILPGQTTQVVHMSCIIFYLPFSLILFFNSPPPPTVSAEILIPHHYQR